MDFSAVDRIALQLLQMPDDATIFYTPLGGSRVKLDDAIFRSPTTPIIGSDFVFEGVGPQFSVHSDDVPLLQQDDKFERATVVYIVKTVDKDETSMWIAHCRLD